MMVDLLRSGHGKIQCHDGWLFNMTMQHNITMQQMSFRFEHGAHFIYAQLICSCMSGCEMCKGKRKADSGTNAAT